MDPSHRPTRRRSIPRLPDFSITPLKTHIDNSLADEHGGHSYSQPQTPRSPRSAFHSPSHTPTVLSRASSRDPSRSGGRRRKVKSALLLADLERPLSHASNADTANDEQLPHKSKSSLRLHKVHTDVPAHPMKGHTLKARSIAGTSETTRRPASGHGQGPDWLLSTASILAMNTAESKGQAWLATKSSSTSLVGTPYLEKDEFMFRPLTKTHDDEDLLNSPQASRPGSRRNSLPASTTVKPRSRGGSRNASRIGSRVGSRVNLLTGLGRRTPGEAETRNDYFANMSVEFADQNMAGDDDSGSELDEFEENELKKLVWGRVGGWVDWAVGWMDWRDGLDGLDDNEDEKSASDEKAETHDATRHKRRRRATIKTDGEQSTATTDPSAIGLPTVAPPPEEAGVLGDAKWLAGVVGKLIV